MANYPQFRNLPGTRPAWVTQKLFPFESRFISVAGHNIHYIDEGKEPIILLLHGNPAWSFLFRKVIAQLSTKFRCVSLDYPGFGLSHAADGYDFLPSSHAQIVAAFIEKLSLRNVILAVSDWGGPIGLSVAAENPENIAGLIIGNTFAWPVNDDLHFIWFSRFFGGTLGRFLIRNFNAFVNMLLPMVVRHARLSEAEKNAYRFPFPTPESRLPTHIFPREILASHEFLGVLNKALSALKEKPTLFLWGEKDIAFRLRELEKFQTYFPVSKTKLLPQAGHFIWEDSPEEIAAAICDLFLPKK